jgi:hypothetical protein
MYQRPPQYKKTYGEENLHRAYEEVKEGQLSIRQAAEQYGAPKYTLSDRVTGRVKFNANSGPARYLTDREEDELVSFIGHCAKMVVLKLKKKLLQL